MNVAMTDGSKVAGGAAPTSVGATPSGSASTSSNGVNRTGTNRARRLLAVSPATPAAWRAAIEADPFALPEQSPEWIAAICATSGAHDESRAYTFSDGDTLVVPLVRTGPPAIGSVWSPPPAWGIGGIVGHEPDRAAVRAIVDDLRTIRAPRVSVRIDARQDECWRAAARPGDIALPRRSHVIDLDERQDDFLARLPKSTRYNIRRTQRNGVRVEVAHNADLLETHYELFLLSVRRWAANQHEPEALALFRAKRRDPIDKLRAMSAALGERFMTVVAYVDDRPAASAIVLLGATTRYTRGAMDIDIARQAKATYAVQWRAIEATYAFGSRRYHMGESGTSDGIGEFKERLGAIPIHHHEYRFERVPMTRTANAARGLVKRVIGFRD